MKSVILTKLIFLTLFSILFIQNTYGEATYGTLSEPIIKIMASKNYRLKMTTVAIKKIQIEYYQKKDNFAQKLTQENQSIRIVGKDGFLHYIIDYEKTIVKVPIEINKIKGLVDAEKISLLSTGKARFNGKQRDYDEYTIESDDDKERKILFFVEKEKLVGLRVVEGKTTEDLAIDEFDQRVPSLPFNIPTDYKVREAKVKENEDGTMDIDVDFDFEDDEE